MSVTAEHSTWLLQSARTSSPEVASSLPSVVILRRMTLPGVSAMDPSPFLSSSYTSEAPFSFMGLSSRSSKADKNNLGVRPENWITILMVRPTVVVERTRSHE